ncbi:MAG: hypothetical protein HYT94_04375 [Parcubacteria group bacterium]|nr:hypothetical protein [Parcubacteria group bacterium]
MSQETAIHSLNKDFESIKKIDTNGVEYWEARELLPILGYPKWEKAEMVIGRAAAACLNSGQAVDNHFHRVVKMVEIGSNTVRNVGDWKLDRYACYLVAQNGDSKKPEIALAQTYFAIQTRKQEIFKELADMVVGSVRRSYDTERSDHKIYKHIVRRHIDDEWLFQ